MSDHIKRQDYRRVTNVLYPFSGLDKVPAAVVQKAADRGTKVHKICEGIISGLGEFEIDDDTKGCVESFKLWWAEGHHVIEMEKRFYDDERQLTGQCDLIIKTDKGLCIVDLKTSYKLSKTWRAQGSAYAMLARQAGYDIQNIMFIHLNRLGKYPDIYEYPVDDSFFLAILRVFNYFYGDNDVESERTTAS
jgi:hypothetical protein